MWIGHIKGTKIDYTSVFLQDGTILHQDSHGKVYVLQHTWQPRPHVGEFKLMFTHYGQVVECKYVKLYETPDWVQEYLNKINNIK